MTTAIYPYSYLIGWTAHDRWYYGIRYAKGCHPSELWKTYHTSSNYVKIFREAYGEPDVIEVRRTFEDKNKAIEWEKKVLTRLKVNKNPRWLNATVNAAPHKYVKKHNPVPGMLAAKKKLKGKTYEDLYGPERAKLLKEKRSRESRERWKDPSVRDKMTKRKNTEGYRQMALKRHADPEYKKKHSDAIRESWKKRKGIS